MPERNYTVGKGEVYFGAFKPGTRVPEGERYVGNSPQFSVNIEASNLDHFSSDRGLRELDESVPIQVTRTASLMLDDLQIENLGLFFFGTASRLTTISATAQVDTFVSVIRGMQYQLGTNAQRPSGVRNVTITTVALDPAGTALVAGTDYIVDTVRGRIQVLENSPNIASGASVKVTYTILASSRDRIISGSTPIEGVMRYLAYNPEGANFDYFFPSVKVRPNGDFALKTDEWQQLPLTVQIMKPPVGEAVYIDGQAIT